MLTAARAGLPVVDGDGMGRAFPEIQMSTFFIYGLDPSPGAIADDKGNVVVFKHVIDMYLAGALRPPHRGGDGRGRGLRDDADAGRLSQEGRGAEHADARCSTSAAMILDARAKHQDVISRLIDATGAKLLFTGKVTGVRRELRGGFAVGEADIAGVDAYVGLAARGSRSRTRISCCSSTASPSRSCPISS